MIINNTLSSGKVENLIDNWNKISYEEQKQNAWKKNYQKMYNNLSHNFVKRKLKLAWVFQKIKNYHFWLIDKWQLTFLVLLFLL